MLEGREVVLRAGRGRYEIKKPQIKSKAPSPPLTAKATREKEGRPPKGVEGMDGILMANEEAERFGAAYETAGAR
jgi:hypothetical protein